MSVSRLSLAFAFPFLLLLSLSFASSPVQCQPAGSLALVCRTGNNFISYYGMTHPNSPMLKVGFKHDETAYSVIRPANLGAGNCTFTSRAMLSYEPLWLQYWVDAANPADFEVAVTGIRLPRTVNQVMLLGGDAAAKSMFALGTTTGDLVGLYVVPIAQPVNYAYKVVGTFTPSQILIDRIDPLPIKTTLARTTSADFADLSQEQIQAEEERAQYEAGLADTSSTSASNGGNNDTVYIAVGSAIGGLVLGMILTLIAISYRARRHSQKHVTRIGMTNTEHQHEPQLTANPAVVHVNQL